MPRALIPIAVLVACSLPALAQDPPPDPQRPTFRSGAHYVRVDAYPTRDGRPIAGLTADDFELLEDGRAQAIDRLDFVEHPEWTPLADRRNPSSQRAAFDLARDANYRVFVLYLDAFHVDVGGSHRLRLPIAELLSRMMGPQDLFGLLTPAQTPDDLILGQLSNTIEEQLARHWTWGLAGREQAEPQPGELELEYCFPQEKDRLIALRRLDKVYGDLEGLVAKLGDLREERKNVVYFSDALYSPSSRSRDMASDPSGRGDPPPIGTTPEGRLTLGSRGGGDPGCSQLGAERSRLLSSDFQQRFFELLRQARHANVAFYTVRPGGLDPNLSSRSEGLSNLQTLAEQTDGLPLVLTNDLRASMQRIADDLSSHYVLGYYTSNTRWDGRPRKITVKLKATGQDVRARREYRAPTEAEMTAIRDVRPAPARPTAAQTALSALARISPSARVNAYGAVAGTDVIVIAEIAAAEIEGGRWKTGADVEVQLTAKGGESVAAAGRIEPGARGALVRIPVGDQAGPWQAQVRVRGEGHIPDSDSTSIARGAGTILGSPLGYRAGSAAASPFRPLAAFQFRRTERVRIEWPLLQPAEAHEGRLLDRNGNALAVPVATAIRDSESGPVLAAEVRLAPLSIGEYLIEVKATHAGATEEQVIGIRVAMAR